MRRLGTFSLKLEAVFYDTTGTYFEEKGPDGLAKKGFSVEDIFKIRPIFHWTPSRVRAHIFICFLAFLFSVSLQRKLFEMNVKESVWRLYIRVSLTNKTICDIN